MRKVFFSFDYRDVWTTNIVRNSWVAQDPRAAGFLDKSLWEEAKKKGDAVIKNLIDDGLRGTSVTVVLIGPRTESRKYVRYEIEQSLARRNGFVGIHLASVKDANGCTRRRGANPLHSHPTTRDGNRVRLSDVYQTYDWIADKGFKNLGRWVDEAAVRAGRPMSQVTTHGKNDLTAVVAFLGVVVLVVGAIWIGSEIISHLKGPEGTVPRDQR
jgi:hypothetical protein